MRGRGGYAATSFKKVLYKPIETYPYNPNCELNPVLTETEREMIVFSRLLKRHANEGDDYVQPADQEMVLRRYGGTLAERCRNPDLQRERILGSIEAKYFPAELLGPRLNPGSQQLGASSARRAVDWAALEARGGGRVATAAAADGEPEADDGEPDEDYGGEDYGQDHYADEDRDDDFQDGADGDGADDY